MARIAAARLAASRISARIFFAAGCIAFGNASRTFAFL
jgi:hypothetical protein